jgi:hypothetical protein
MVPKNSANWRWARFHTNFLFKFKMPLNMKVLLCEKLDNFYIGRIFYV